MILGELGLLHTDVGNYRIALGYLLDRDKLPYSDNAEGLDVLLSKAQALLHVGRDAEAAGAADAALAMIARVPALAKYRLLALDWAALDHLAAQHFVQALALYDEEIPLLDASNGPLAARNRMVARFARASAAIGAKNPSRALANLDDIERRLANPTTIATLLWPHATADQVSRAYRLIASGLRANANRQLGRWSAESQALGARWRILDDQIRETHRVEIERDALLTEAQLALSAGERRDKLSAAHWLSRAMTRAADLRARSNGLYEREELDVLWLAANLTVSMKGTLAPGLPEALEAASAQLASRREPSLRSYARRFEVYGPLLRPFGNPHDGPVAGHR